MPYTYVTDILPSSSVPLFSLHSIEPIFPMKEKPCLYSKFFISIEPISANQFFMVSDKLLAHSSLQAAATMYPSGISSV